jgi:uncharacterized membrane protein YedE/YeeE
VGPCQPIGCCRAIIDWNTQRLGLSICTKDGLARRIDMANFTPVSAAIGGALIGIAATLLMLLTGRIAGISGIFAGLVLPDAGDRSWRLAFLAGLILAPLVAGLVGYPMAPPQLPANWGVIVGAGLLVGFGTRLGSGCTSGHGICGIARLSARSLVATAVFVATAAAVVAVSRHVIGG